MIQTIISSLENAEEKISQMPQPLRALKIRTRTLKSLHKIYMKLAVKRFLTSRHIHQLDMRDFTLQKYPLPSSNTSRNFRKQSHPFTDKQFQFVYSQTIKSDIS